MGKLKAENLAKRKAELEKVIKSEGSAYKAAQKLGVTPSSLYERAHRYGIKIDPEPFDLWPGEPAQKKDKKSWLKKLIATKTIAEIARDVKRTYSSVWGRIEYYGLEYTGNLLKGEPAELKDKIVWMKGLLERHGSVAKVSEVLGITTVSVYERCERYSIRMRHLKGEPVALDEKKVWLEGLLKSATIAKVSKRLGITASSLSGRIKRYGIKYPIQA